MSGKWAPLLNRLTKFGTDLDDSMLNTLRVVQLVNMSDINCHMKMVQGYLLSILCPILVNLDINERSYIQCLLPKPVTK